MDKVLAFVGQFFTDAKLRPEVKMVIAVPLLLVSIVYGMLAKDWVGFGAMSGVSLVLMGITAAGDAAIDQKVE